MTDNNYTRRSVGRPSGRTDARAKIIEAAFSLAGELGLDAVTIGATAERAGYSKNALRYHFASKTDLLGKMLEEALTRFDADIEALLHGDHQPGAWLRAYVKACFLDAGESVVARTLVYVASLGHFEGLSEQYSNAVERWTARAESDGVDPLLAQVVRLAADGLWWSEVYCAPPFDMARRNDVFDTLLNLTKVDGPLRTRIE